MCVSEYSNAILMCFETTALGGDYRFFLKIRQAFSGVHSECNLTLLSSDTRRRQSQAPNDLPSDLHCNFASLINSTWKVEFRNKSIKSTPDRIKYPGRVKWKQKTTKPRATRIKTTNEKRNNF